MMLKISLPSTDTSGDSSIMSAAESELRAIALSLATSEEPAKIAPLCNGNVHYSNLLLPSVPARARIWLEGLRVVLMHGRTSLPMADAIPCRVIKLANSLTPERKHALDQFLSELLQEV